MIVPSMEYVPRVPVIPKYSITLEYCKLDRTREKREDGERREARKKRKGGGGYFGMAEGRGTYTAAILSCEVMPIAEVLLRSFLSQSSLLAAVLL